MLLEQRLTRFPLWTNWDKIRKPTFHFSKLLKLYMLVIKLEGTPIRHKYINQANFQGVWPPGSTRVCLSPAAPFRKILKTSIQMWPSSPSVHPRFGTELYPLRYEFFIWQLQDIAFRHRRAHALFSIGSFNVSCCGVLWHLSLSSISKQLSRPT